MPDDARVAELIGTEALNALSSFEVLLESDEPGVDLEALLKASATLRLHDELEAVGRTVALVVQSADYEGQSVGGHGYRLRLAPPAWLLTLRRGYRIFRDKTTRQIVTEVLEGAGIAPSSLRFRLSGEYLQRLHCTQYDESEWSFVERLLADEGISYWFDFDEAAEQPLLVCADDRNAHEEANGGRALPFFDPGDKTPFRHLHELERIEELAVEAVQVREYDVRAPDVYIDGAAGKGAREYFEYPACVLDAAAAGRRAQARLEQLQRFAARASGASDCLRVQPGRVLTVGHCADEALNGDYLVVGVEHRLTAQTRRSVREARYENRVLFVPWGETAFRPDRPRRRPKVGGIEPAFTTGAAGEEIHVDDLGRVKVRFPWDRTGIDDDTTSTWVRCLQMSMAGAMVLPRVGWEVAVAYVDGNPDVPFVLGRTYNATAIVPYGLPGAAATSTFQSATSPGDGTTNEIRMGDSAGGQELFVHATRDQTVTVGGSATSTVGVDETHDVKLALIVKIDGDQTLSVGADQKVDVGAEVADTVKGSRSETIGGMEHNKVTANRIVSVAGGYTELIGALYGIQCNQANASVKGAYTNLIGGAMGLAGGLGVGETVVAARTEIVAGGKTLTSRSSASESVLGAKSVTAGPTSEDAGSDVVTSVKAAGKVKVGGSATLKAGGTFAIEAPTITIKAASLAAGGMKLAGGKLDVSKGTTKVKGNIKRKGGGQVG
ncbi:MAG: type VI secretion system tip protein VgrG [Myxococcales bacterium]|nr:type VI secretion system tip protein VgrG [Myxococcales bacterium]